jgi:hypothetical protein
MNTAPTVMASGNSFRVAPGQELVFTVMATDADGDVLDLNLINPPASCAFTPVLDQPTPAMATLRWLVMETNPFGRHPLTFEARDGMASTRFTVEVEIQGNVQASGVMVGDVTGDGVLDVVAAARLTDVGGTSDVGALHVWQGATTPSGTPSVTLTVTGAATGDGLGDIDDGQGLLLGDVTGDGTLDIVAGASSADLAVQDAGAIYVWRGGSMLASGDPTFTLSVSSASMSDQLGRVVGGQGILLGDLTGDGVHDIIAGASFADVAVADAGAIHVWGGGAMLATGDPTFTLSVSGASASDQLGSIGSGQGILLAEVTGDASTDLIAGATLANGAAGDQGAVYVWSGAALASGDPDFTLMAAGAFLADRLGSINSGQGILIGDVAGDAALDIIAAAGLADAGPGALNTGEIYVWQGGAMLASGDASFTLSVAGATTNDLLCALGGAGAGQGLSLADVSGDMRLDIVAGASNADIGGTSDAGAIYVWNGGATLSANPNSTLTVTGAASGDGLGNPLSGQGILLRDVTGDGDIDVVANAASADLGGTANVGAIYVWEGGAALTSGAPTHTLSVTGSVTNTRLGFIGGDQAQGVLIEDVVGDASPDIIAGTSSGTIGGTGGVGAIYVWAGGTGFSGGDPDETLSVAGAVANDALGFVASGLGQGILTGDISGDGRRDIVAMAFQADVGGVVDAGALYAWMGSATTMATNPDFTWTAASPSVGDSIGDIFTGHGFLLADVTGDGTLDVVAGATQADLGAAVDAGAIYVGEGGSTLGPNQVMPLSVPGAVMADELGDIGSGQGILCADVTGDGVLDLVAGASEADVGGTTDAGAIYVWRGAGALAANPIATLAVPGATTGDRLGF